MSTLETLDRPVGDQPATTPETRSRAAKHRIPTERNRQIYEEVVIGERPQDEVARAFGVSQQRVSQIVEQFQGWLAENLPAHARDLPAQEQLSVAVNVAYLRCERASASSMRGYEASRRDKLQRRERFDASGQLLWTERVRQNQSVKIGNLNTYLKASKDEVKIVQMAGGLIKVMEFGSNYEEPQFSELEATWAASSGAEPFYGLLLSRGRTESANG